jgi:FMN-dependent NADH-azoreductase
MANVLPITSSPRGSESYSNRIADTVIRELRKNDPDAQHPSVRSGRR